MLTLLLALPVPAWAGSSQATLAVAVVVAPRCAVRTGPGDTVAMRCTKGARPAGRDAGPATIGPRITRTVLPASAPSPRGESAALTTAEVVGPRLIVTVNF
jgi:hypothetical protein